MVDTFELIVVCNAPVCSGIACPGVYFRGCDLFRNGSYRNRLSEDLARAMPRNTLLMALSSGPGSLSPIETRHSGPGSGSHRESSGDIRPNSNHSLPSMTVIFEN